MADPAAVPATLTAYPCLRAYLADGSVRLAKGELRCMLLTSKYRFSPKHRTVDNVKGAEVKGEGYTPGGLPVPGRRLVEKDKRLVLAAEPVVWPMTTVTAKHAALYQSDGLLVALMTFRDEVSSTADAFRVGWPEGGVLALLGEE